MEPTILKARHIDPGMMDQVPPLRQKNSHWGAFFAVLFAFLSVLIGAILFLYLSYFTSPDNLTLNSVVTISSGETVREIGASLESKNIIKSKEAFVLLVKVLGVGATLHQGDYFFEKPDNLSNVIERLASADFGVESVKVLIPEGYTRSDMAKTYAREFPEFSEDAFMRETNGKEGYLFPDTYIFFRTATSGVIVSEMTRVFNTKTLELQNKAAEMGKNWADTITVASLVELEGKSAVDRAMIADIIYRRIALHMPLQLDAPFLYFMNKASLQLTSEDLFAQSPYNTYRNKGLPPSPIASPGTESINAAISPLANEYLYYLSDKGGAIHYAKTFEEHKKNKLQYLSK